MNKYELALVISVKLEEEERAAALEKVKAYIDRFGGTVTNVDEWGKKTLAYPIKKETEGIYILFTFVAKPEFISEFERILRLDDIVLKHMVIKKDN